MSAAPGRCGVSQCHDEALPSSDGAQGLYERQGFTPFGVEPCAVAVGERYVSKVHMWCDLRSALG
jgi:hypothetical protein